MLRVGSVSHRTEIFVDESLGIICRAPKARRIIPATDKRMDAPCAAKRIDETGVAPM
jgi:hypothetical protein